MSVSSHYAFRAVPVVTLVLAAFALIGCGSKKSAPFSPVEVLYSTGGTSSTGIQFQIFPIDPNNGTLGSPATQNNINLGIPAVVPSGSFYYALDAASIYGYAIGPAGTLTPLHGSPFMVNFSAPYFVTADPAGKFLFVSDYTSIDVFAIDSSTGALTQVPGSPFPNNFFTNQIALTPSGGFLYVVDGDTTGQVTGLSGYSVDRPTGFITPISGGTFTFAGPRSDLLDIVVHPNGLFLYFSEDDGIHVFTISQSTGVLTAISSGPVIPLPFPTQLTINPTGTVLYVVVGGAGTIAAYSIDSSTGALTEVAGSPYQIFPNPAPAALVFNFVLDPLGQFLYVKNSGIEEFSVNSSDGALTQVGTTPDPFPPLGVNPGPQPFAIAKLP